MPNQTREIELALDRLQTAIRDADNGATETVTVKFADLLIALQEMDRSGIIDLDLD